MDRGRIGWNGGGAGANPDVGVSAVALLFNCVTDVLVALVP